MSYGKLWVTLTRGSAMKILWHTLYQHLLALRIWWYCRHDERLAQRVAALNALLQQDVDVSLRHLR